MENATLKLHVGVLYLIVNNEPEITTRMSINAIQGWCDGVRKNDPFCVVYVLSDEQRWYKGEYCYNQCKYFFHVVGLAAIPDVILMMELVKP